MARKTREQEYEDDLRQEITIAANNARSQRLYAVEEKLEALGISITDLMELLEDRSSRGY